MLLFGVLSIRELPFGSSLSRMVLLDCSRAFVQTLKLGEGQVMGGAFSKVDNLRGFSLIVKGLLRPLVS